MKVVSIQVQTTKLSGAGVTIVPYKSHKETITHWSLYKRYEDGTVSWVMDIAYKANSSFTKAMVEAAKLSIENAAFIEPII